MLTIRNIYKSYSPDQLALAGVDLTMGEGEIVCLLGPSGCGKTTLLRIVAGLEKPEQGEVWIDEQNLATVPVHKRNFGFMFQEFALFPHRNVTENVGFGLRMAGISKAQISARVAEMLELVNLAGYDKRTIFELSGGERQRVALARSLAPSPRLLMLDEPLGSLDRTLREELMSELRLILKRVGQTVLFVTHDQQEALAIADRIVVMNRGRIEQIDTPQQLYQQPANAFVARFLGFQNLLPATVHTDNLAIAHTAIGALNLAKPAISGEYTLLIRPTGLIFAAQLGGDAKVKACIESLSFRGEQTRIELAFPEKENTPKLFFTIPARFEMKIGEEIWVGFDPQQMQILEVMT